MSRDISIDILKGVAIFLVVLAHIKPDNSIVNFIYSFHMLLFMFLSGCTFWYSYSKTLSKSQGKGDATSSYACKRAISLLLPYICWTAIMYYSSAGCVRLLRIVAFDLGAYWFLPTLFCVIGVSLLLELSSEGGEVKEVLTIIAIYVTIALSYRLTHLRILRQVMIYWPPFYLGAMVKKYGYLEKVFCSSTFVTVCTIGFYVLFPYYSRDVKSVMNLAMRFVGGLFFTEVLYNYVRICQGNDNYSYIKRVLVFFGKHSLEIYILSEFFRPLFSERNILGIFPDSILKFIYAVIVCILSIFISSILRQSRLLRLCLYGEMLDKH